eukprot:5090833-Lingulodinium_polyedra.AAC.1
MPTFAPAPLFLPGLVVRRCGRRVLQAAACCPWLSHCGGAGLAEALRDWVAVLEDQRVVRRQ